MENFLVVQNISFLYSQLPVSSTTWILVVLDMGMGQFCSNF